MVEPQLLFHDIAPGVTAFSTTRHGGFSRGNYAELNINQHCGDAPEATENYRPPVMSAARESIGTAASVSPRRKRTGKDEYYNKYYNDAPGAAGVVFVHVFN